MGVPSFGNDKTLGMETEIYQVGNLVVETAIFASLVKWYNKAMVMPRR